MENINREYSGFKELVSQSVELAKAGKQQEAAQILQVNAGSIVEAIGNEINATMDLTLARGQEIAADINRIKVVLVIAICLFTAGVILIGIRVSAEISRQIKKPIERMVNAASHISKGDLSIDMQSESKDEIGILSESFRDMIQNFKLYIKEIDKVTASLAAYDLNTGISEEFLGDFSRIKDSLNHTVDTFKMAFLDMEAVSEAVEQKAEQTAEQSGGLAQNVSEQAGIIQELAATITVVTEAVNDNAREAKKAERVAADTAVIVESGNRSMQDMVKAISQIDESTNKIQVIIKTIEDIANQTNMLSLNASIEAARAGEAGRGFAVVAGEIGNLADESKRAAQNIIELVKECVTASKSGTQIVQATADSLVQIVEETKKSQSIISDIAQSSETQSASLNEAAKGMDELAELMQTNSSLSEEGAAASEELLSQSELLKSLIEKFKIS